MKQRLKQRTEYDCFPTCVSCITGIPYEELPILKHCYMYTLRENNSRWGKWQKRTGYKLTVRKAHELPENEYYIGLYPLLSQPYSMYAHAVVCYNGEVVHNVGITGAALCDTPIAVVTVDKTWKAWMK